MRFEQLAELTDEELALVLAGCQPDVAMLALAGAAPDLVRRVVAGLSRREAKLFQQRLESIGPIRLQDMERAQQYLAELAARMVESGKIQQSLSRRFAAAA